MRLSHAGARQHTRALHVRWCRDQKGGVHLGLGAFFEQQRNVEKGDIGVDFGQKLGAVSSNEWVNHSVYLAQGLGVAGKPRLQGCAVNRPLLESRWAYGGDGANRCTAFGIKPMHCSVCIPNRDALGGKHGGCGGFSHADRACQAKAKRAAHIPSTAARVLSSTWGRWPNQRSKPGAAWCSSIPRPSTICAPRLCASVKKGVISGV